MTAEQDALLEAPAIRVETVVEPPRDDLVEGLAEALAENVWIHAADHLENRPDEDGRLFWTTEVVAEYRRANARRVAVAAANWLRGQVGMTTWTQQADDSSVFDVPEDAVVTRLGFFDDGEPVTLVEEQWVQVGTRQFVHHPEIQPGEECAYCDGPAATWRRDEELEWWELVCVDHLDGGT